MSGYAHVGNGSNSEVELADADFRFTPESRHPAVGLGCPFRARKRLMHRNNYKLYSITWSARASNVAGTSMPSVLAVFRLITSSNLIGLVTGRSAGFSPFRTRPV